MEANVPLPVNYDTTYIEDYSDWLVLRAYGIYKDFEMGISRNYLHQSILMGPNQNLNLGFGFNYRWLGINFGFNFPFVNDDDDIYGHTRRMDGQMNLYGRKFIFDGHFQLYKGLYMRNPKAFYDYEKGEVQFPIMPQHKIVTLGGSFYYMFNHQKFSSRSVFTNNERQKKSAGSWMLGGFLDMNLLSTDSVVVPEFRDKELLLPEDNFRSSRTINAGIKGGYIYTFVFWKEFYINIAFQPGFGYGNYRFKFDKWEKPSESLLFLTASSRVALGRNGRKYFWGLYAVNEAYAFDDKELQMNYSLGHIRFFWGMRFDGFKNTKMGNILPF